jgi:small subunit ribosomal protein S4e
MVKDHIKRINAPKRWDVLRKENMFITRPNAGRDFTLCLPLNTVLKEMLSKTQTTKESKYMIKNKDVMINSNYVYDEKYPVGFLDVVSFPALDENYRLLVNEENTLFFLKIKNDEAKLKLSKVWNKKNLSKGTVQINCSDGRNFEMKSNDPVLHEIKIFDSISYTIPDHQIKQVLKLEKGALVFLYKGKHIGKVVMVDDFKRENIIFRLDHDVFETKKAYAFVIGKDKPVISVTDKLVAAKEAKKTEKVAEKPAAKSVEKTAEKSKSAEKSAENPSE